MYIFVEEQIKEAVNQGEFDNLPGKGEPLDLRDETANMSPEVKQAYKLLKNAGYITEETEKKSTITVNDLLADATDQQLKEEQADYRQFQEIVNQAELNKSPRYKDYARKIFRKLFKSKSPIARSATYKLEHAAMR